MGESETYCSCVQVEYLPVELEPGYYREKWVCVDCGSEFLRASMTEHQMKLLKEQLGIWKRKAAENLLVAGRWQFVAEKSRQCIDQMTVTASAYKDTVAPVLGRFSDND